MAISPITRKMQTFKNPKLQVGGRRALRFPKSPTQTGKGLGIGPASAFWIMRALQRDMNQSTMQNLMKEINENASDEEINSLYDRLTALKQGGFQP